MDDPACGENARRAAPLQQRKKDAGPRLHLKAVRVLLRSSASRQGEVSPPSGVLVVAVIVIALCVAQRACVRLVPPQHVLFAPSPTSPLPAPHCTAFRDVQEEPQAQAAAAVQHDDAAAATVRRRRIVGQQRRLVWRRRRRGRCARLPQPGQWRWWYRASDRRVSERGGGKRDRGGR